MAPLATSFLDLLRPIAARVAPRLATRAFELGLAVTRPDGTRVPIAVTLTPAVIEEAELRHRHLMAFHLAHAGVKMARALIESERRELLLGALSPLERRLAETSTKRLGLLAITRVDFFVAASRAWALELNSTIPAMPGYSDIAAQAFLETVGAAAGLRPEEVHALQVQNGSNVAALRTALQRGYAELRAGELPEHVGVLCRRHDPQISELEYCVARFTEQGLPAEIIYPDEIEAAAEPRVRGRSYPLLYRHLFVRRLEETPAPAVMHLLEHAPTPGTSVLLNPPSTPVEVKTTFAFLSQSVGDDALAREAGLSEAEREAIAVAVPWTRMLRFGGGVDPDGKRVSDLVAHVAADPARFVLKRAWEYGGRAVFIGASAGERSFQDRTSAIFGERLDWAALCGRAATDNVGGGFVVQERVVNRPEIHLLTTAAGFRELELFVDYSAYASVGLTPEPAWGGVCRGSASQIVNIVGGGGVVPLLTESVAKRLLDALQRL